MLDGTEHMRFFEYCREKGTIYDVYSQITISINQFVKGASCMFHCFLIFRRLEILNVCHLFALLSALIDKNDVYDNANEIQFKETKMNYSILNSLTIQS